MKHLLFKRKRALELAAIIKSCAIPPELKQEINQWMLELDELTREGEVNGTDIA